MMNLDPRPGRRYCIVRGDFEPADLDIAPQGGDAHLVFKDARFRFKYDENLQLSNHAFAVTFSKCLGPSDQLLNLINREKLEEIYSDGSGIEFLRQLSLAAPNNLRILQLHDLAADVEIMSTIRQFVGLHTLGLPFCTLNNIDLKWLSHLDGLKHFSIASSRADGGQPIDIAGLANLKGLAFVDCTGVLLRPGSLSTLRDALPGCEIWC